MNKKVSIWTFITGIFVVGLVVYLVYNFNVSNRVSHKYYQVYLGGDRLGLIESEDELYKLIDEEQKEIKEQYGVDKVYPPSKLEIQEVNTYSNKLISVKDLYEEIKDLDPFTIGGYQIKIKNSDGEVTKSFYVLNDKDVDTAIEKTVEAFLSKEEYESYLAGNQVLEDDEEGKIINNVYFDQEIAIKKTYISTEEEIIKNADDLSAYFLFGTTDLTDTYKVKESDTIESIAYNNELGVQDLLIANPELAGENSLLAIGQEVNVASIHPIADVVVESYDTEYAEVKYNTQIEYDKTLAADQTFVKQEGSNGLSKVKYATKYMNGIILQTALVEEEVITEPVDRIVVYGGYNITYVGNSTYWAWPTTSPFRFSSYYGYRYHPVYHTNKFHDGVDIVGTKSDNIYSIQEGNVTASAYSGGMGNYVKIDHGNGYLSVYMHLSKRLVSSGEHVEKGELIGIMGCTGTCTGKHLHFTIYKNGSTTNPLSLYQ